jgi:hypothetical protein
MTAIPQAPQQLFHHSKNQCMKSHHLYSVPFFLALAFLFIAGKTSGCDDGKKSNDGHAALTNAYSSEVAIRWMDMQLELIRTSSPFIGGLPTSRPFAYAGIALYESVVPGMPACRSLSAQLTAMPAMPKTIAGNDYHWPACANAALAAINRSFFPNTSEANKTALDALEMQLNTAYRSQTDEATFRRSVDFGKAVAGLIINWSKKDGYATNVSKTYSPLTGPGSWAPTPPRFLPAFGPYWGTHRLFIAGSLNGITPPALPEYATDPSSDYYKMAKEVYDVSQTLTPDQIELALYYRDYPGFGDGHYISILKQLLQQKNGALDFAAMVCAKAGIACVDAGIGCWKIKYQFNQERPVRYIREVMGHSDWEPLFDTPPFPDFPSGHSAIAGSFTEILRDFFGNSYHFTDHTYDYLGMKPRTYNSFDELVKEICNSRLYAGIHYRISCEWGTELGRKIARNINNNFKFEKDDKVMKQAS